MNKTKRIEILSRLRAANPNPTTELEYSSPFELLIAVLLSAQATDVGVNKATRKLFPVAPTPAAMLALGVEGVKDYIKYCQMEEADRPYTSRYIGSLVSDIHRNMIKGGIYLYPTSSKSPKGKLRLLYECNPLAFVVEQAGGKASDGKNRIMELQPTELHQRIPFFCGSKNMVDTLEKFML